MSKLIDFVKCKTDARLDGKVALVTGATSGVGLEVAKSLSKRGAKVIIASRNPNKLEEAKKSIIKASNNDKVVTGQMDFASLKSVRDFASETIMSEQRLDILINNVGALGLDDKLSDDNLHLMMQVNYFGTFLLTYLLFPLLKKSAPSRIINVTSIAHMLGVVDLEHLNDVGRHFSFGYYSNAKLADMLFTVEMEKRIRGSNVSVFSMDPGLIQSDFFRNYPDGALKTLGTIYLTTLGRSPHEVAKMPVFLAVDPRFEGKSGRHFRDCEEFYGTWFAGDTDLTYRLWELSKKLVNITESEDWERSTFGN